MADPDATSGKPAAGADWIDELIRDFQDTLTGSLYDAIYELEPDCVGKLMRAQARTCVGAFLNLGTLRAPLSLDAFLDAMRTSGPSRIDIRREGDVIHWTERHQGQCVCPFVRRHVIRLDPQLCICGAHWVERLFETVAATRVTVETLETAATGAENCCFRIVVQGPAAARPASG